MARGNQKTKAKTARKPAKRTRSSGRGAAASRRKPAKRAPARRSTAKPRPRARSRARDTGRQARKNRGLLRTAARWTAAAAVWAFIAVMLLVGWHATGLPDLDQALAATRRPSVTVLAADGKSLAVVGDDHAGAVRIKNLPPALPQAVIATEDRRFESHFGLDPIGLARAMWANVMAGRVVQGGSTISQQVAKNLFLGPERTLKRKIQELLLAFWLEYRFTKDEIMEVYLNRVYLGAGTYGVEAAARRYFGRSATGINIYESAMLAGLLKAPSRYNPHANPDLAAKRTRQSLANMVAAGYLDKATSKSVEKTGARLASAGSRNRVGRYFVDWALERAPDYVGTGDRDLRVKTTLDPALQRAVENSVRAMLDGPGRKAGASQAAVVVLDTDGAVLAMAGGRDYRESQFNRATLAKRQPGSTFKPFVFLAGLEAGLSPGSRVLDGPVTVEGWSPRNFNNRFLGNVKLKEALAQSLNAPAVRVAETAGRAKVAGVAKRLGIASPLSTAPSLALGSEEVSLLELTAAYAPFANGGFGAWAFGVEEIADGSGTILYERDRASLGRVVDAVNVGRMNEMLAGAIDEGTGRKAAMERPVAGKTGTSQGFRDAWFVGYSADRVAGVWMGNDDGRGMKRVTGGGLPAELWREVMTAAHKGIPPRPLPGAGRVPSVGSQSETVGEPGFWGQLKGLFGG